MSELAYGGTELELFARAARWKAYVGAQLRPWLKGDVLEVGAGIGANAVTLCDGTQRRWVCLEPDSRLAARIPRADIRSDSEIVIGTLGDLAASELFDFIGYFDVLEHIEDDRAELARAAAHLRPSGALAVLAPAHQWLYSPFDSAVGHHRRYSRSTLSALDPPGLVLKKAIYLDAAGIAASLANKLVLRSDEPTEAAVLFWDRALVPISRVLDPVLGYALGKSVFVIWQRPG